MYSMWKHWVLMAVSSFQTMSLLLKDYLRRTTRSRTKSPPYLAGLQMFKLLLLPVSSKFPPNFWKTSRKSTTFIQPQLMNKLKNPNNTSRGERLDKPHFHKKTGLKGKNNPRMGEILLKHMEAMTSSTDLPMFSATCTCTKLLPFQWAAKRSQQVSLTQLLYQLQRQRTLITDSDLQMLALFGAGFSESWGGED